MVPVFKKNITYSLLLIVSILGIWLYRRMNVPEPIQIQGKTMGTDYHITYFDALQRNFKPQVDSLLEALNQSLSTYRPDSEITRYNAGGSLLYTLPYFFPILQKSKEIAEASGEAFDPTVMPLVNAWGFGPGKKILLDSAHVDSIRNFIGFTKVPFNTDSVWKKDTRVQLDFSAIAKGYGVDVVADFMESKQIKNLFIEIGGEVLAKGKNIKSDRLWEIGILHPNSDYAHQSYIAYATLINRALATSGNYFNYYQEGTKMYSHTIDPQTGYPVQHAILSSSVFASDCATADAWATAFMVMGHEKAIKILSNHLELDAFLVYSSEQGIRTYATENIKSILQINL